MMSLLPCGTPPEHIWNLKRPHSSAAEAGLTVECITDVGGSDNNKEHWYRAQVVQTAKESGHWANLNEDRFFINLSINPENSLKYHAWYLLSPFITSVGS